MDPATGIGIPIAFLAGLVSFLSPCVLPLVPGYLSAVSGLAPGELDRASARRVLGPSLLFVGSFSLIFIVLGVTANRALGDLLQGGTALRVSGGLIALMGLFLLLTPWVPRLGREWHVDALMRRAGSGGPVLAGAAFAIAWTPCIGPTLGPILVAASQSSSAGHGALLLAVYSAGLAVPFIATSLAFGRMTTAFAVVKRHYRVVITVGGVALVAMGILILTGEFTQLNIDAQRFLSRIGLNVSDSL